MGEAKQFNNTFLFSTLSLPIVLSIWLETSILRISTVLFELRVAEQVLQGRFPFVILVPCWKTKQSALQKASQYSRSLSNSCNESRLGLYLNKSTDSFLLVFKHPPPTTNKLAQELYHTSQGKHGISGEIFLVREETAQGFPQTPISSKPQDQAPLPFLVLPLGLSQEQSKPGTLSSARRVCSGESNKRDSTTVFTPSSLPSSSIPRNVLWRRCRPDSVWKIGFSRLISTTGGSMPSFTWRSMVSIQLSFCYEHHGKILVPSSSLKELHNTAWSMGALATLHHLAALRRVFWRQGDSWIWTCENEVVFHNRSSQPRLTSQKLKRAQDCLQTTFSYPSSGCASMHLDDVERSDIFLCKTCSISCWEHLTKRKHPIMSMKATTLVSLSKETQK